MDISTRTARARLMLEANKQKPKIFMTKIS